MYEQVLGAVASKFGSGSGGGGGAVPSSTGAKSGGVSTIIAPGGINLGAILQPLNEGNGATGGYDVNLLSRLGYLDSAQPTYQAAGVGFNLDMSSPTTWVLLAGAGIGLVFLLKKKGR